jgi:hypothetical protein
MFGTALRYGAISGAIIISVLIAGIVMSRDHADGHLFASQFFGYLVMLVALSLIFIAIREHRNKNLGGVIKFLPAFGMGLLIAFIAGVIYVIGWEIYLAATNYTFMDNYIAHMVEAKRAAGVSGPELDAFIAEMNQMKTMYANPLMRMPMTFVEIFPVGLIVALISAAVLRNPRILPARA